MPSSSPFLLDAAQGAFLLDLARASIRHGLDRGRPLAVDLEALSGPLREPRATFVTLMLAGTLRGCVGRLVAERPLAVDIAGNAFAAAFRDGRFPPVRQEEVEGLEIHLSLLGTPEPIPFASEADLAARLVPGRDGVILEAGLHRSTFLPSVWEALPDPQAFLRSLKAKAGLPVRQEVPGLKAFRYTTESIGA